MVYGWSNCHPSHVRQEDFGGCLDHRQRNYALSNLEAADLFHGIRDFLMICIAKHMGIKTYHYCEMLAACLQTDDYANIRDAQRAPIRRYQYKET